MVATRSTDTSLTWIGITHQGTAAWAISAATMILTYRCQDPFGNDRGEAVGWIATQQDFHTGTEDPTGLVSMGARFYAPTTGRFISRDPIRGFTDSQQVNGYAYASNSPVLNADPSGLIETVCSPGGGGCKGNGTAAENPATKGLGVSTDCPPQWCDPDYPGNGEDWNTGNYDPPGGDSNNPMPPIEFELDDIEDYNMHNPALRG